MEFGSIKGIKLISWFLGISMFVFGILKVISPTIAGWYAVQMTNSGISAYVPVWLGITGEILTGTTFIIALVIRHKLSNRIFRVVLGIASVSVIFMMLIAVYVHLQPAVPAEVLPLGIKAPYIPVFSLLLALTNIYLIRASNKTLG